MTTLDDALTKLEERCSDFYRSQILPPGYPETILALVRVAKCLDVMKVEESCYCDEHIGPSGACPWCDAKQALDELERVMK